jgi:hypothetical protein
MDSFTKEGVPWLLPIPFKFGFPPLRGLRLTTGEAIESFVVFPGLIAFDIWVGVAGYSQLLGLIHHVGR